MRAFARLACLSPMVPPVVYTRPLGNRKCESQLITFGASFALPVKGRIVSTNRAYVGCSDYHDLQDQSSTSFRENRKLIPCNLKPSQEANYRNPRSYRTAPGASQTESCKARPL